MPVSPEQEVLCECLEKGEPRNARSSNTCSVSEHQTLGHVSARRTSERMALNAASLTGRTSIRRISALQAKHFMCGPDPSCSRARKPTAGPIEVALYRHGLLLGR